MKRGLTVDDSAIVRKVIMKMLSELNLESREAENGQVALEQCAKEKPDFILLDWNMPVMDGLEFMKHFRSDQANDKVVVIFCTTENEIGKIQEALAHGSNEYIMKPFDIQVLKDKLIQTGIL